MRVLIINVVCGIGSTGRICTDLAISLKEQGHEVKIAYGRDPVPEQFKDDAIQIGTDIDAKLHGLKTRILDGAGFGSRRATACFLKWADKFNPDYVWLHNLHGYYINIELLFDWIKLRPNMKVNWTFHDCWNFTGHCTHAQTFNCNKWQTHCEKCPAKRTYPASFFIDNSFSNFDKKKKIFSGVKNLTIITPSKWLADLVKKSFLCRYPVVIKHNLIDTNIFKPISSDFKKKYHIENKKMLLGVASSWSEKKGLYDFMELSSLLGSDMVIVLVGLTEKQKKMVGNKVIGISKTNNPSELAKIYSAADVFLNLTYEDTYPTVNLESQACGTPVISYRTGGSTESVPDQNIVEQGDLKKLIELMNNRKLELNNHIFYETPWKLDCGEQDPIYEKKEHTESRWNT